jgi:GGDEF domain-containing protein
MEPLTPAPPGTETQLRASVPLFDPSQMPLREWCAGSREDPVTGLIAFPDFHAYLPHQLTATLLEGKLIALAIGDVDGLKQHVEVSNVADPASFGHLAGNQVMAKIGAVARAWFGDQPWPKGCLATFGGDEVIVAAAVTDPGAFIAGIGDLRDRLVAALPVPVSFAVIVVGPSDLPDDRAGLGWPHPFTDSLLAAADRCLFAHKALRRATGGAGGVVALTAPPQRPDADLRTLTALPVAAGEVVHTVAQHVTFGDYSLLLLPFRGPEGQRGRAYRVTMPQSRPLTQVVMSVHGRAALSEASPGGPGEVPVILQALRPVAPRRLPGDLAAALKKSGLSWDVLPEHEQVQLLHLIRESAGPEIRKARVTAALAAVSARSRI